MLDLIHARCCYFVFVIVVYFHARFIHTCVIALCFHRLMIKSHARCYSFGSVIVLILDFRVLLVDVLRYYCCPQRLSTSPEQEPPHFEEHIRSALRVLRSHPKPHITLFPDARPRTYHLNCDGLWLRNDADMK